MGDETYVSLDQFLIPGKKFYVLSDKEKPPNEHRDFTDSRYLIMNHLKFSICWALILNFLTINCREPPIAGKITNGQTANEKDFPYIVVIIGQHLIKGGKVITFGAGAMLSDKWIVTSKNVVFLVVNDKIKAKKTLMVLPKYNNNAQNYRTKPKFGVEKVFCSNRSDLKGDLTLLKLKHPIPLSDNIKPIKIINKVGNLKTLRMTGWGMTDPQNETHQFQALQQAEIELNGGSCGQSCRVKFEASNGKHPNACYGDEGGPVVTKVNETGPDVLVGLITGFDENCRNYSVFLNISTYKPWINDMMSGEPEKYRCGP
ncbi:chymotrypsin-like protease CTRL-1 [Brevipalpus obovatus]|uniref:chymotrypsin-like protease CTRL-1 n=1 Tax=Brevipalpus obovatus TaxID=246614 RepID=UPI003D9DC629